MPRHGGHDPLVFFGEAVVLALALQAPSTIAIAIFGFCAGCWAEDGGKIDLLRLRYSGLIVQPRRDFDSGFLLSLPEDEARAHATGTLSGHSPALPLISLRYLR